MARRTLADAFIRLRPDTSEFARGIERAGREAVDDLQDKLRRMHLPIPNVEISTADAARDIEAIENELRDLARQSPDVEVDVNVAAALREIKAFKSKIGSDAEDAGESAGRRATQGFDNNFDIAAGLTKQTQRFKSKLGSDAEDAGESAGRRATQGFNNKFDIAGSLFTKVAAVMASRMVLIGAAVSGMAAVAAPAIGSVVQSIVELSGSMAALPALAVAGGAGFAVLKIGTEGFFDAIKAGGDSLDDLMDAVAHMPKPMADTAIAIDSFRERYEAMQTAIQTNLFAGLAGPIRELGNDLFPALEKHLPAIASGFSTLAENLIQGARAGGVFKQGLHDALDSTAVGLAHANNNVGGLVTAFGRLMSVGAPFVERLGIAIDNVVFKLGQFINTASDARITGWIEKSILVMRQLGSIVASTFSIIGSLMRAAENDSESFLGTVARLMSQFALFLKTTEGQGQIREFFDNIKRAVNGVGDVFKIVWPSIKEAAAALQPVLKPLATVLSEILIAVAPLLPHFTSLGVILLTAILPVVKEVAKFFKEHETAAKALATTILGLVIAVKLYNLAVGAARLATIAWAVAAGIAHAAAKVWTAAQWVLNAALAANPIGIVVIALAALVAGFIIAWQTSSQFRDVVISTWNGIRAGVGIVVNWFVTEAWPRLQTAWDGISAGAYAMYRDFLLPAFRNIRAAAQDSWGWIQTTGLPVLQKTFHDAGTAAVSLSIIFRTSFAQMRTAAAESWGWMQTTGLPALQTSFVAASASVSGALRSIESAGQGLKAGITPIFVELGLTFMSFVHNVIVPAASGIGGAFSGIQAAARGLQTAFGPIFVELGLTVRSFWVNAVQPAAAGVGFALVGMVSAARALSTQMEPVFRQIGAGMLQLQQVAGEVARSIFGAFGVLIVAGRAMFTQLQPLFRGLGDAIIGFLHSVAGSIAAARGYFEMLASAGRAFLASLGSTLRQVGDVAGRVFAGVNGAFERTATVARNLANVAGEAFGRFSAVARGLLGEVAGHVFPGVNATLERTATVARNLANVVVEALTRIVAIALWLLDQIRRAFAGVNATFERTATVARNLANIVVEALTRIVGAALGLLDQVRRAFAAVNGVFERTATVARNLATIAGEAFGRFSAVSRSAVTQAGDTFRQQFDSMQAKAGAVVGFFTNTVVPRTREAFNSMKSFVTDLSSGFRTHFDQIRDKVNAIMDGVKRAFQATKDAIKTTWDQIKEATRTPINYVINPVYAKIRDVWNAIAGKIPGLGKLDPIAQMATGGVMPGYTPGRDVMYAHVSGGEAIMRPEWTRAVGPAWVDRANAAARQGGVSGAARFMGGYAEGGIIGDIAGFLKGKGEEFALGSLLRLADPVIKGIRGLIGKIPSRGGKVGEMAKGIPTKLLDAAIEFIKQKDVAPELGGEGGSLGTGGASIDKIIGLAKASKIPFNVTSTYRPGDPLYHGSKRAVDFGGYNQDKFATFWMGMRSSLLELIHRTNSKDYGVSNGRLYAAGSNSGLLNEHRNHVHVAMNGNAVIGGGGGGGGGVVSAMVAGWIRTALAREGVANWQAWMETLVKRESGGNRFARSFSSNGALGYAIGLAQLLSGTFAQFRDKSLPNDRTDPIANLVASIRYIKRRYGSIFSVGHANPNGRADPGGYAMGGVVRRFDKGGMVRPGEFMFNGGRVPELATPTDQPIRLHPKDLKMLGEIIGSQVVRAIGTFGSVTARSADLLARS